MCRKLLNVHMCGDLYVYPAEQAKADKKRTRKSDYPRGVAAFTGHAKVANLAGSEFTKILIPNADALRRIEAWSDKLSVVKLFNLPQLESLPAWPDSVKKILLNKLPRLSQLPQWPPRLKDARIGDLPLVKELPLWPQEIHTIVVYLLPLVNCLPPWPAALKEVDVMALESCETFGAWPAGTEDITLSNLTKICTIPEWPAGARTVTVRALTQVDSLPAFSPGLVSLELGPFRVGTPLQSLPDLPDRLDRLSFKVVNLAPPATLPKSLTFLEIVDVHWPHYPPMPENLKECRFSDRFNTLPYDVLAPIKELKVLELYECDNVIQVPDGLRELHFNHYMSTAIPPALERLHVSNYRGPLPNLPPTLCWLRIDHSHITSFGVMDGLREIEGKNVTFATPLTPPSSATRIDFDNVRVRDHDSLFPVTSFPDNLDTVNFVSCSGIRPPLPPKLTHFARSDIELVATYSSDPIEFDNDA